jgi:hypothetical protein
VSRPSGRPTPSPRTERTLAPTLPVAGLGPGSSIRSWSALRPLPSSTSSPTTSSARSCRRTGPSFSSGRCSRSRYALVYGEAALAPAALGATLQTALAPALWVLLSVLYHGLAEHLFGNTPGQYRHGLLVARREDRGRPTLSAAVLRAAARPVDGLLFGLFGLLVSRLAGDGRRLGDLLAGTLVLDTAEAIRVLPTMDLAVARTRREIRAKGRPPRPLHFEPPRREPPWENPGAAAAHSGPGLLDARERAEARRSRHSRRPLHRWYRGVGGCSSTPFTRRWAVFHAS